MKDAGPGSPRLEVVRCEKRIRIWCEVGHLSDGMVLDSGMELTPKMANQLMKKLQKLLQRGSGGDSAVSTEEDAA